MIEATVTMLKFPPISSSGPWWLTERKYPASPGNRSLLKDSLPPSSESLEHTTQQMRCSTASTLSVRSSRAARKKGAVRSRAQGTPAPLVSSSTLMRFERPVPAHNPRVQVPTHAHPTSSTNKGGRGRGVTWVGLGGVRVCPPPSPGGADLAAKATPTRLFPSGDRRAPMLFQPSGVSKGRKWVLILQLHHQFLPLMLPRYQAQTQYKKEP